MLMASTSHFEGYVIGVPSPIEESLTQDLGVLHPPQWQLLGIHHLSEIKALAGSSVCVIAAEACAQPGCLRIARCQNSNGISP